MESETGGRVVSRRRLHGGIIARTDELRTTAGVFVLQTGDVSAQHQARVLAALEAVELPVPRLAAVCEGALLMTKLSGRVDLQPTDMRERLRRMAEPLPVLHASKAALAPVAHRAQLKPREFPWVRDPGVRRAAEALLSHPPTRVARVPTHGDYQHFNMLWSRGCLTGIVDWSGIWLGPPEIDVSHCRLNLAVLYGAGVADDFRDAYEAAAGRRVDPWVDVHRIANYSDDWPRFIPIQVHGRAPVRRGMTARVEELLRRALARA